MSNADLSLVVAGRPHAAQLRLPTIGETHVFVANPSLHRSPAVQEQADRLQVRDAIDTFDGEPMSMDVARKITADAAACDAVLLGRAQYVAGERDCGIAFALCPHCRKSENELGVADLARLLGVSRRPIADGRGRLVPFALSFPAERAARAPRGTLTAGIRFRLPSGAPSATPSGVAGGVLRSIDPLEEVRAWQRFAPIGVDPPPDHSDWTFESAGFRAVLRSACALDALDLKRRPAITPAEVEPMTLADFCFLDELYALAFLAPASASSSVECETCGEMFLPVG